MSLKGVSDSFEASEAEGFDFGPPGSYRARFYGPSAPFHVEIDILAQ